MIDQLLALSNIRSTENKIPHIETPLRNISGQIFGKIKIVWEVLLETNIIWNWFFKNPAKLYIYQVY